MAQPGTIDVAVIGGGIVGTATALALARGYRAQVLLLEAEDRLAAHQTGHNSGVMHSGLYYKPGSLKARLCVQGREELYHFCEEQGIAHERCGKLVVATRPEELPLLDALERRGRENGLQGLRRLAPEEVREREPHVQGLAGLLVPQTGIVDFSAVTVAYARQFRQAGGSVQTGARFLQLRRERGGLVLETTAGAYHARYLVNCAGLQSDRVARACGVEPGLRIVPFRGEYLRLRPPAHELVRHLVYPVPDPRFPFLGVHFTRMVDGSREAGPNAVLAFAREGYTRWTVKLRDLWDTLSYGGFWRMALRHWRMGLGEFHRSFSRRAMLRALRRMVPELRLEDLEPGGAGVRAQAMEPDGSLTDDFRIAGAERQVHVLNAPSPAATASLAIGRSIAERAGRAFGLEPRVGL